MIKRKPFISSFCPMKIDSSCLTIDDHNLWLLYVVVDVTEQLKDKMIGRFARTPDGKGYFGYTTNPSAFVEVIPFGKVLSDARLRNSVFFQKLGITNTG